MDGTQRMKPGMVRDFEEWLLIKSDALRYTKEEAEDIPVNRVYRFYGFEKGQKQLQEEERKKKERMSQYKDFVGQDPRHGHPDLERHN